MKLNFYERLKLINQFKILGILDNEKAESYQYKIKILERGYVGLYSEIFIELAQEVSEDVVTEVFDILHMFAVIQYSYEQLSDKEKKELGKTPIYFKGFNGNERHFYVMDFLRENGYFKNIEELDLKGDPKVNVQYYRDLYQYFEKLHSDTQITFEQLKKLEEDGESLTNKRK